MTAEEQERAQWLTAMLGPLLARSPLITIPPNRSNVAHALREIIQQVTQGNISAFAREVQVLQGMVSKWLTGKKIPQIEMLLQICAVVGISLEALFFQPPEALRPQLRPANTPKVYELREKWSHVAIEAEAIQHALDLILATNADPPPSLTEVAKGLGCESLTLYKCHRTAALAISARYKAYTQVRTATRRHNYRVELREAVMHLWERGVPVTRGRMESLLAHPGMLRDPKIRQQLLEVCREMEEKPAAERSSAHARNHDH